MSSARLPLIAFLLAIIIFITAVLIGSSSLPERIATHFDASGRADGWMSRTTHVAGFITLGLGLSTFILGLIYTIRFFPHPRSTSRTPTTGGLPPTIRAPALISSTTPSGSPRSTPCSSPRSTPVLCRPTPPRRPPCPPAPSASPSAFFSPASPSGYFS
jgi:hypothetical protein